MEYMWIVWLAISIFFLVVEGMTVELISIWFTGAGLVAMLLSILNLEIGWQLAAFCIISIILIVFTRPIVARYLKRNESRTNIDSLIGEIATVTKDILPDDRGEVKIKGQYWLAISSDNNEIVTGKKVSILAIEGAKLIVKVYE